MPSCLKTTLGLCRGGETTELWTTLSPSSPDASEVILRAFAEPSLLGCPGPRISFAVEPLDNVCWARRRSLGVFASVVTRYTGIRGTVKGRYGAYYNLLTRYRPFLLRCAQPYHPGLLKGHYPYGPASEGFLGQPQACIMRVWPASPLANCFLEPLHLLGCSLRCLTNLRKNPRSNPVVVTFRGYGLFSI